MSDQIGSAWKWRGWLNVNRSLHFTLKKNYGDLMSFGIFRKTAKEFCISYRKCICIWVCRPEYLRITCNAVHVLHTTGENLIYKNRRGASKFGNSPPAVILIFMIPYHFLADIIWCNGLFKRYHTFPKKSQRGNRNIFHFTCLNVYKMFDTGST